MLLLLVFAVAAAKKGGGDGKGDAYDGKGGAYGDKGDYGQGYGDKGDYGKYTPGQPAKGDEEWGKKDWDKGDYEDWAKEKDWDYEYWYGWEDKAWESEDEWESRGRKVELRAPASVPCLCDGTCTFQDEERFWVRLDDVRFAGEDEDEDEGEGGGGPGKKDWKKGDYEGWEKRRLRPSGDVPVLRDSGRIELVEGSVFGAAGLTGSCDGEAALEVGARGDDAWTDCETGEALFLVTIAFSEGSLGSCGPGDVLHVWRAQEDAEHTYWEDELGEGGSWELAEMEAELVRALDAMTLNEAHMAVTGLDQDDYDALSTEEKLDVWRELEAEDERLRDRRHDGYTPPMPEAVYLELLDLDEADWKALDAKEKHVAYSKLLDMIAFDVEPLVDAVEDIEAMERAWKLEEAYEKEHGLEATRDATFEAREAWAAHAAEFAGLPCDDTAADVDKPWYDFVSCAEEKRQGACDRDTNEWIVEHCRATCGWCADDPLELAHAYRFDGDGISGSTTAVEDRAGACHGKVAGGAALREGTPGLKLDGDDDYVFLPCLEETLGKMTRGAIQLCYAFDCENQAGTSEEARIFDFGDGEDANFFFAPLKDGYCYDRFHITKEGWDVEETYKGAPRKTVGNDETCVYVELDRGRNPSASISTDREPWDGACANEAGDDGGKGGGLPCVLAPADLGRLNRNYLGRGQDGAHARMILFSLDVYAPAGRSKILLDADQRAPLGRGGGGDGAEDLAAAAYDRYRQKRDDDDAAAAAGADDDDGSGIAAAKTELLMLVILFAAVAATAVGVAAFFAARRLKGRVRSPSHFAPVVGAACDVELADARPVDQTFDELATVEAVRVSDAAPPELAVAKATPDGATEKML